MNAKLLIVIASLGIFLTGCCNMRPTDECGSSRGGCALSTTTYQSCSTYNVSTCSSCGDNSCDDYCWSPDYSNRYGDTFANIGDNDFQPMGGCCN